MKRDKTWLTNEIEIIGSETSEKYPHEQMVDRKVVLNLIDQMDEPEKVVIPKFVAEAFEKAKGSNVYAELIFKDMYNSSDEVGYWLELPSNEKLLLRAWFDGYEVEKDKLYYVQLLEGKSYLCEEPFGELWFNNAGLLLESSYKVKMRFTEKEIKDYDERYWPFAVEVTEGAISY